MERDDLRLVVDARPRGPHGLRARETMFGQTMVVRHVETAARLGMSPVLVLAPASEVDQLRSMVEGLPATVEAREVPVGVPILRTDRVYHPGQMARLIRLGRDLEQAVIWRLDRPGGTAAAESEIRRRLTYQPLGRFWAWAPARRLAEILAPTRVRPNQVTVAAAFLMLGGASGLVLGENDLNTRLTIAVAFALALVLDTADGHLARLQGTTSEFGRILDALLDEACDMALHGAIAWALFARTHHPAWLALGIAYAASKYLFVVASQEAERSDGRTRPTTANDPLDHCRRVGRLRAMVRLAGHADIRWHLWIALAAFRRLEFALAAYTIYFAARAAALVVRLGRSTHVQA